MGVDYTAYATWGWEIPREAVPESDPEERGDFETNVEALCSGIDGLGWLVGGAPSYGWDFENCPLILTIGEVARQDFKGGSTTDILEKCKPPDPVTIDRIKSALEERGVKIMVPAKLLLTGSIW